jgi:hypothetical protein
MDVATLAHLLRETAEHRDHYEKTMRSTTGGTGTPRTSAHASTAAPRRRPPTPPGATWRKFDMFCPRAFERLAALSDHVSRWVLRHEC